MTHRAAVRSVFLFALAAGLGSCSMGAPASVPRSDDSGAAGGCFQDADCGAGLACVALRCVAGDGLPPEQEEPHTFLRPAASATRVWALSPDGDTVSTIDPVTLAVDAVTVPPEPFALALVPDVDAAVVLSRRGAALTVLTATSAGRRLHSQKTPRHFGAVSLSPDGKWAVLWTPDGQPLDAGAEGLVGLVDVAALAAGTPAPVLERAAGRRHTDVFFRTEGGVVKDAVIVGQAEIAVLDLTNPAARPVPERIVLPDEYASLAVREAIAPPGGAVVLLRSLATKDVGVFDVATRRLSRLSLPAAPSDLDLSDDGTLAFAVLRETSQVAWFPVPAALTDPTKVVVKDVALTAHDCAPLTVPCAVAPGQAVLSPDGTHAALFTNARASESFGWLTLATGRLVTYDRLEKLVRSLGIAPDGTHAIVLHRPEPGSTVSDPYERAVDQAEGYSIVDLAAGFSQLKLTDDVAPLEFVFSPTGSHAAVTLRRDTGRVFRVEAVDLSTLVTTTLQLASAPQFAGPLPGAGARVWVTQEHPAGRISFVDLAGRSVRTATGFELNAEIGR